MDASTLKEKSCLDKVLKILFFDMSKFQTNFVCIS